MFRAQGVTALMVVDDIRGADLASLLEYWRNCARRSQARKARDMRDSSLTCASGYRMRKWTASNRRRIRECQPEKSEMGL